MVPKTKSRENLEQLQGSLRKSVQGILKIIHDLEDLGVCSKCTILTSQCVTFHQDAAGPHPGAVKSRNGDTSRQNIVRTVDEYNFGYIKPSRYSNHKTGNSTVRERPSGKIGTSLGPSLARTLGIQQSDPIQSEYAPRPKYLFKEWAQIRP